MAEEQEQNTLGCPLALPRVTLPIGTEIKGTLGQAAQGVLDGLDGKMN